MPSNPNMPMLPNPRMHLSQCLTLHLTMHPTLPEPTPGCKVLKRSLIIGGKSAGFGLRLLGDKVLDAEEANGPLRANQLTELLTQLGEI